MASLGVLFAVDEETASALLAASDDDAVLEIVEQIEVARTAYGSLETTAVLGSPADAA